MNKKEFAQNTESYIIHLLETHTKGSVQELCDTFGRLCRKLELWEERS